MKQVVIENPIINSPFEEPKRHFLFSEEGITNEILEARRVSSYFVPIAKPKKKGKQKQLSFETEFGKYGDAKRTDRCSIPPDCGKEEKLETLLE